MNAIQTKIEAPPNVYQCIAAVQGELAKVGIGKNNANTQQNYKFRGIDDVYNVLASLLSKHGLVILPRMIARAREERVSIKEYNGQRKESVLFYVTVDAEFDFVSAGDGSTHTVRTYGEAMDSGDKATNKAMSAAYKYMAFMTFAIPTEGDNDADATTHEVVVKAEKPKIDPDAKISDKTCHALQDLIITTGGDVPAFCRDNGLTSLNELTNARAAELAGPLKDAKAKAEKPTLAKELEDAINF